jgi:OOP family OmpA-OmpF porin
MNKKIQTSILTLLGLFCVAAQAEEQSAIKPFISAKTGWQFADDDAYKHSAPNSYLIGLTGGFQFTPSWSWDIGYQYQGKVKANVTQVSVQTSLIESALRYDFNLTPDTSIYGRLGAAYWFMDKKQPALISDHGFSPLGEIGVKYQLTPDLAFNLGYQHINSIGSSKTGKYNSNALTTGLSYQFGGQEPQAIESQEPQPIPAPPAPVTHIEVMPTMWLSSVYFGFDSASVVEDLTAQLSQTIELLNKYPQAHSELLGYADPRGAAQYNLNLSKKRAEQVAKILETYGIARSRMTVHGKGELELSSDASKKDYTESRRVDIELLPFEYEVIK